MAATLAVNTANADYLVNMLQSDVLTESTRKSFLVKNINSDVQNAIRAYEGISQASIDEFGASVSVAGSGANATATSEGLFPLISGVMVLSFKRAHPITTVHKTVTKTFAVLVPHPDVYDDVTLKPVMIRGETFATALAADRPTALGSLVDWLEDALVYEHDGVRYYGSFTYDEARSGLITVTREFDGNDAT